MSQAITDNVLKSGRNIKILKMHKKLRLKKQLKSKKRESTAKSKSDSAEPANYSSDSDLLTASFNGEFGEVKKLLNFGVDVDQQDSEGLTALVLASKQGHIEVVKLLLSKGAQVDKLTNKGKSALMKASKYGHTEIVQLLVEDGANVNLQSSIGETALFSAVNTDHREVVSYLLENGAMVDLQEEEMEASALMIASANEDPEVAEQLIKYGADVNILGKNGISALMIASVSNCPLVVQLLLDHNADINAQYIEDGKSALLFACEEKNPKVVKVLLENGAQVDLQKYDGSSALLLACDSIYNSGSASILERSIDLEVIELLLENGAQINLQNEDGVSSLMLAMLNSDTELVSILLKSGAHVDLQDHQGQSPLIMACALGFKSIVNFLIEYGAQIDLQDKDGKSALIYAVSNGYTDLAVSLIELGAQIDLQDNEGWFPLMFAVKAGDLEMVQLLIMYGASLQSDRKTIFDICPGELFYTPLFQELFQTFLTTVNSDLRLDSKYPGIIFFKSPIIKCISSSATEIDHLGELGISISVPEDSLSSSEEPLELAVRPCFSGPFKLPRKYKSASPAFLIHHSRRVEFQKDITIRILHDFNLRNEEDCEDMVFLSASATPEYKGSRPVYVFKKIRNAKTVFRPGDQVGEIALRHFCLTKVAVKRKREEEETTSKKYKDSQHHLYSARLYRNLQHIGPVSAVFCISMIHPIYTKHSDSVISAQYTGMTEKGDGRSEVYAEINGDEVIIHSDEKSGFNITFDKKPTKILKRDIHLPELMNIDVHELTDYPPRLLIYVQQISPDSTPPEVQVIGLDRKCTFELEAFSAKPLQFIENGASKESTRELPQVEYLLHENKASAGACLSQVPMNVDTKISPQHQKVQEAQSPEPTNNSMLATLSTSPLGIGDLGDVLEAVEALSARWRVFCTKLRLSVSSLDLIEKNNPGDSQTCLCVALGDWLRQNYDHQRHGKPSWRKLAEAARSLDNTVFENIVRTHAHS